MVHRNLTVERPPLEGDDVRSLQAAINRRAAVTRHPRVPEDGVFGYHTLLAARREGYIMGLPHYQLSGPVRVYVQVRLITPSTRTPAEQARGKIRYAARLAEVAAKKVRPFDPRVATVRQCATAILAAHRAGRVTGWAGLSTGNDLPEKLVQAQQRGQMYCEVTRRWVTPDVRLMRGLAVEARRGTRFTITALTGGGHSNNSRHYYGAAVDMTRNAGGWSAANTLRRYGGWVLDEGTHIHVGF